jgi:C-terminal processing protease CtpA/Prc
MIQMSRSEQQRQQQQAKEQGQHKKGHERIEVIEIVDTIVTEATKPKPEKKNFYWGIGITSYEEMKEIPGQFGKIPTRELTEVFKGYAADEAGLVVGDTIFLINGNYIPDDDGLRGDGPRKMLLTVYRKNGITIRVPIERCKVYY